LFVFVGALTEHLLFEQVSRRNVVLQAHRHGVDGFGERELEVGPVGGGLLAVVFVLEDFPEKLRARAIYITRYVEMWGWKELNSRRGMRCVVSKTYGSNVVLGIGGRRRLLHARPCLGVDLEEPEKACHVRRIKISGGGARTHVGMWGAT
jgi:hypothetical protein